MSEVYKSLHILSINILNFILLNFLIFILNEFFFFYNKKKAGLRGGSINNHLGLFLMTIIA